jgi:hypothetical protein
LVSVRADFVKRRNIFDIDRMNDTAVAPRAGFSYLLTKDARNVIRGSYVRVYEQVMGETRHAFATPRATETILRRQRRRVSNRRWRPRCRSWAARVRLT